MDSIVKKLSEIDDAASAIVDSAQEKKSEIEKEIQAERNQFDKDLEDATQKKLQEIEEELQKEIDVVLDQQRKESAAHISALKEAFEQHHTEYAKDILARITKV